MLIDWLEQNPFTPMESIINDSEGVDNSPKPYQRRALEAILKAGKIWDVTLYTHGETLLFEADLRQKARGATISITVAETGLGQRVSEFLHCVETLVAALPKVSSGRIGDGNADLPALYKQLQLDAPPACFTTHLDWMHFLGPQYYTLFLSTDDLLAAPAYQVKQMPRGVVQLICYPKPFAWDSDEAHRYLRELTEYINARDVFMQDL